MANQFLSLSLFLMLLSFFIVMNAVSDFDDTKAKPVMNSLSLAFTNQPVYEPEALPATVQGSVTDDKREGDTLEAVEGLFNAHIAGFEAKKNRLGTVMHVRIPVGKFERALDFSSVRSADIPVGEQGSFVATMVTLLRSAENGQPYRLDIVLNVADDPVIQAKKSQENFMANLRRVSHFAEILEASGMPKKMLSAGLKKGSEGYVDLYFLRYEPFVWPENIKKLQRRAKDL